MITLISICDLFWLLWLLPLLLGMLLTWLYWRNKYANMVADYDGKIKGLNGRISGLEGDLAECGSKRADLEGDLAITKGRMREIEADMKALKVSAEKNKLAAKKESDRRGSSNIAPLTESTDRKPDNTAKDLGSISSSMKSNDADTNLGIIGDKDSNLDVSDVASSLTGAGSASLANKEDDKEEPKSSGTTKKSIYSGVKSDNLQIIEGIGPKMESVLKENGVNTHAELAAQSPDSLNAILRKYGDKYKIIDPTTWAQQASYAAEHDFEGMIDLQKKLDTGKDTAVGLTDSKLEKYLIKTGALKAFKQDDLKAIEGIGPATEKLLHSNGIKTWRELANTEASAIKAMLTAAGSRFALGDPTTWPKQAELAADGKFDELREYQDFLDGGRG